jgi:hypothetical protein
MIRDRLASLLAERQVDTQVALVPDQWLIATDKNRGNSIGVKFFTLHAFMSALQNEL